MHASIYTLADPRKPEEVRYVGWTSKSLGRRLIGHLSDARRGVQGYRPKWIRSLLKKGIRPVICGISTCPPQCAPALERTYITAYRALGFRLTNGTDGGDGTLGHVPSAEAKKRMSAAHQGKKLAPFSAEHRKNLSTAAQGRKLNASTRAAISRAHLGKTLSPERSKALHDYNRGKKRTPEQRQRMTEAQRRRWADPTYRQAHEHASPETRAKMSASHRARLERKRLETQT